MGVPRAISIAASVSILTISGIFLFDTVLTDLEHGILSAEEAMGIYNPKGEECILRPQENVGKRCKSTSGYTKFSVDAVDGKWPEGFSWTILNDEEDGDVGKGLLHTESGAMSD